VCLSARTAQRGTIREVAERARRARGARSPRWRRDGDSPAIRVRAVV